MWTYSLSWCVFGVVPATAFLSLWAVVAPRGDCQCCCQPPLVVVSLHTA